MYHRHQRELLSVAVTFLCVGLLLGSFAGILIAHFLWKGL